MRLGCSFATGVWAEFCWGTEVSGSFGSGPGSCLWESPDRDDACSACCKVKPGEFGSAPRGAATGRACCAGRQVAEMTSELASNIIRYAVVILSVVKPHECGLVTSGAALFTPY